MRSRGLKISPGMVIRCFCSDCRINCGHLGQLIVIFNDDDVIIEHGNHSLKESVIAKTRSGLPEMKGFYSKCGCTILTKTESFPEKILIRFALLDSGFEDYKPWQAYFSEQKHHYVTLWQLYLAFLAASDMWCYIN